LSCFLDELPWELTPRPAQVSSVAIPTDARLIVNSSFRYAPHGDAPPEIGLRAAFMDGLLRAGPLAWIQDSGTEIWTPFWVRGEWVAVLESLRPGEPAPETLSAHVRETLARANVLVAPDNERTHRGTWERICRDAGAQFRQHGYAIVRNL